MLELRESGVYCPAGDFYVDPWEPVARAVITHAHSDHAREGSAWYLGSREGAEVLRYRVRGAPLETLPYGEKRQLGDALVSLHPAGHILGSAQVRIEAGGQVWVLAGDYKRDPDPSCTPFEVVPCDVFVSEATFAMPIYDWPSGESVARQIVAWWDECAAAGRPAVLFAYALGKAQRILAELARLTDRRVLLHGAVLPYCDMYRAAGVELPAVESVYDDDGKRAARASYAGELIIAPPSAAKSTWMRRFKGASTGFASGWMQVRGIKRRRAVDRGFVLSDHAGWRDLLRTIDEVNPRLVIATHGSDDILARYLNEHGREAVTAKWLPRVGEARLPRREEDPEEGGA